MSFGVRIEPPVLVNGKLTQYVELFTPDCSVRADIERERKEYFWTKSNPWKYIQDHSKENRPTTVDWLEWDYTGHRNACSGHFGFFPHTNPEYLLRSDISLHRPSTPKELDRKVRVFLKPLGLHQVNYTP